jgi:hypothetical protein
MVSLLWKTGNDPGKSSKVKPQKDQNYPSTQKGLHPSPRQCYSCSQKVGWGGQMFLSTKHGIFIQKYYSATKSNQVGGWGVVCMAQAVEHLPSKHEALSSSPNTAAWIIYKTLS